MVTNIVSTKKEQSFPLQVDRLVEPLAEFQPLNTILDNKELSLSKIDEEETFKPYGDRLTRFNSDDSGESEFKIMFLMNKLINLIFSFSLPFCL